MQWGFSGWHESLASSPRCTEHRLLEAWVLGLGARTARSCISPARAALVARWRFCAGCGTGGRQVVACGGAAPSASRLAGAAHFSAGGSQALLAGPSC